MILSWRAVASETWAVNTSDCAFNTSITDRMFQAEKQSWYGNCCYSYVVLAPDLFHAMEPRVALGYDGADLEKAFELYRRFDPAGRYCQCQPPLRDEGPGRFWGLCAGCECSVASGEVGVGYRCRQDAWRHGE